MTTDDLYSIDDFRDPIKKLWSYGIKQTTDTKESSFECRYQQTTGINKLIRLLGFRYKPEVYFKLAGEEKKWAFIWVRNHKKRKEELRNLYNDVKRLAEVSDFLFDPSNQKRYGFEMVSIGNELSDSQLEEVYVKSFNRNIYYIAPKRRSFCTAVKGSPNNVINFINEKTKPKAIVSFREIYEEVSELLEVVLNHIDLDLTLYGYGIKIKGKTDTDALGMSVCASVPTDVRAISTFQACAGGSVTKDTLDYHGIEVSFSETIGKEIALRSVEIEGKLRGTLKFSHINGKGLNVTVSPELEGSLSLKEKGHALEVIAFKLGGEIGLNFKLDENGNMNVSPVAGAKAQAKAGGQTSLDMGVKLERNGEIVYTGFADPITEEDKVDYWSDLQDKRGDLSQYEAAQQNKHSKSVEISPPSYSYKGNRVGITNGIVTVGLMPKQNQKMNISIGFNLFENGLSLVKRIILDFEGTWDDLGAIIGNLIDKEAIEIISNVMRFDRRWEEVCGNLFPDVLVNEKTSVSPNPKYTSRSNSSNTKNSNPNHSIKKNPRKVSRNKNPKTNNKFSQFYKFYDTDGNLIATYSSHIEPKHKDGYFWKLVKAYRHRNTEVFVYKETAFDDTIHLLKSMLDLNKIKMEERN